MKNMKKGFEKKIAMLNKTVERINEDLKLQIWDRDQEIDKLKIGRAHV